jgi:hypothetical protein
MYQRNKQTQGRNGLNMFISIPPYSSWLHIFLSSPWNFLQNRSHSRSKSKSQQIQKNQVIPCNLTDHVE